MLRVVPTSASSLRSLDRARAKAGLFNLSLPGTCGILVAMRAVALITILAVTNAAYDSKVIKHEDTKPVFVHSHGLQKHPLGISLAYPTLGNPLLGTKPVIRDSTMPYGVSNAYGNPIVHPTAAVVVPNGYLGYNPYGVVPSTLLNPYRSTGRLPLFTQYPTQYPLSGQNLGHVVHPGEYPSSLHSSEQYPAVEVPSQSYGVPAVSPTYAYGSAPVSYGHPHNVKAVLASTPYGISDTGAHQSYSPPHPGQLVPSDTYGHGDNIRDPSSHEPPVYLPGYSLSYAPNSFSPVFPHKVESSTVSKGHQYGKH